MSPILRLDDVDASYGHVEALSGVSFELQSGSVLALLGANGAGKSTTVRVISGLLKPVRGRVFVAGTDVTGASPERLAAAGVCVVPEGRGVFPRLSVEEHLRLAAPNRRGADALLEAAFAQFPRLGERRKQLAGTLSGGERQMLALARAVATNPPLLIIDELSLGLAPLIVAKLYEQVRMLADRGLSILVVEQFAHDVLEVADSAVVLQHGQVARIGAPREIADELAEIYLASSANNKGAHQ